MNHFCEYCVGGNRKEHIQNIKSCEFKDCPFYRDRFTDITHEEEVEISKKLLGEMGVIK